MHLDNTITGLAVALLSACSQRTSSFNLRRSACRQSQAMSVLVIGSTYCTCLLTSLLLPLPLCCHCTPFPHVTPPCCLFPRLMLEKMNKVLSIDQASKQIKVQAQMTLKNLYDAADAAHLSTPRFGLPWWQGLTLGGVFATSSHGSGNNVTHMIVSLLMSVVLSVTAAASPTHACRTLRLA